MLTAYVVYSSLILFTLMMEATRSPKRRLLQEPHVIIFQKMAFFIVIVWKGLPGIEPVPFAP
jgi:hypothetical protein